MRSRLIVAASLTVLVALSVPSYGAVLPISTGPGALGQQYVINGINASLNSMRGRLFVPGQAATSGQLGAPVIGGGGVPSGSVGFLSREVVQLNGVNARSTGRTEFSLHYQQPASMAQYNYNVETATFRILLSVYDLDFQETTVGGMRYFETMQIDVYDQDPSATGGGIPTALGSVLLNSASFEQYLTLPKPNPVITNNRNLTYELSQRTMGSAWLDMFDDKLVDGGDRIALGRDLWLGITVISDLTKTTPGATLYRNTREDLTAQMQFTPVPEPMTLLLLTGGAATLLRVRGRKSA